MQNIENFTGRTLADSELQTIMKNNHNGFELNDIKGFET